MADEGEKNRAAPPAAETPQNTPAGTVPPGPPVEKQPTPHSVTGTGHAQQV
ncbi:MAG: hypothetical protein WB780_20360 [Candidatus Acidiferrales bacterium]